MERELGGPAGRAVVCRSGLPLFARPTPTLTNEQASGTPVGRRPDNGQKQDIRFGGDDPNASGLLKIHVSPTRAALRPSTGKDFVY